MKKWLIISILVLVGAAVSWSAAAQDCWQYHNVNLDFRSSAAVDPGDFDYCHGGVKALGTIKGEYKVCWYWDDFLISDDLYDDGFTNIETSYYYSWIETKKGTLELREWGWFDADFGLETGFAKVMGGTGNFEGAIGTLSWTPRFPALGGISPLDGYICTFPD